MTKYDEIRYPSACVEPPVPKCYLGQLDAQNDVLVLENLGHAGWVNCIKSQYCIFFRIKYNSLKILHNNVYYDF